MYGDHHNDIAILVVKKSYSEMCLAFMKALGESRSNRWNLKEIFRPDTCAVFYWPPWILMMLWFHMCCSAGVIHSIVIYCSAFNYLCCLAGFWPFYGFLSLLLIVNVHFISAKYVMASELNWAFQCVCACDVCACLQVLGSTWELIHNAHLCWC